MNKILLFHSLKMFSGDNEIIRISIKFYIFWFYSQCPSSFWLSYSEKTSFVNSKDSLAKKALKTQILVKVNYVGMDNTFMLFKKNLKMYWDIVGLQEEFTNLLDLTYLIRNLSIKIFRFFSFSFLISLSTPTSSSSLPLSIS